MPDNTFLTPPKAGIQFERGTIRISTKFPANNNYVCSYEVFVEGEFFKPENGRAAMINFVQTGATVEKSYYDYGRFCFFLPNCVLPMFEYILNGQVSCLAVHFVVENGRPARDQAEAQFKSTCKV